MTKKITIEVSSDLTPMHQEIMLSSLVAVTGALQLYWKHNSRKAFTISIDGENVEDYKKNNNIN